jgi:DNA-binding Xre family transcriptional regulator
LAGVSLTAPPPIRRITPLQRWLDDHQMTSTSLAVELAIPKETTLALASGSTERISLKYLQAIQDYTQLDYKYLVDSDEYGPSGKMVAKPLLSGDVRIDTMCKAIEKHLHQHTQHELSCYIDDDFMCSGESFQKETVTRRCLSFDAMCKSNENNDNNMTNTWLSASWINLDGRLIIHSKLLFTHWLTTGVDPYGTVTKNYTSLFLRLVRGTGDMADDELPQIRRWWWRIPTEFPQPT